MNQGHQQNSIQASLFKDRPSQFIIRLNIVDCLTLTGVLLYGFCIALILTGQFSYALAVLYISVLADAFDGVLARKFHLERPFGRYLDGFVDTLDYLIVPAMFLYVWGFDSGIQSTLLIVFIACGFIRLSVFNDIGNINDEQAGLGYLGAPVFWSALVLGPLYALHWLFGQFFVFVLITVALPLFSLAMLHNSRYYKFKQPRTMLIGLLALALFFTIAGLAENGTNSIDKLFTLFVDFSTLLWHSIRLAFFALLPVILAGVLHMVIVTENYFPWLAKPIHQSIFGKAKTWRGFVLMPLLTSFSAYLIFKILASTGTTDIQILFRHPAWLSGAVIGFAYIVAELPNSAFKRVLGIPAGQTPQHNRWFFITLDQLDSILGCCLAFLLLFDFTLTTLICVVVLAFILALLIKRLLFVSGYKKTAT